MNNLFRQKYDATYRYIRLRPHFGWSVFSFFFLLSMLLVVRWNGSSDAADFNITETVEMVELRLSETQSISEIQESDDVTETEIKEASEDKPLSFGVAGPEFSDLADSAIPPRPLFSKLPRYPDSMRKARVEGVVAIEIGINESGNVLYGKVIKSLGREFDHAVIEWARRIRFYPAKTKDRDPMKCRIILPVRFKLEG